MLSMEKVRAVLVRNGRTKYLNQYEDFDTKTGTYDMEKKS